MIYHVRLRHQQAVHAQGMGFTFHTLWFTVADSPEAAERLTQQYFETKYEVSLIRYGGYVRDARAQEAVCQIPERYLELLTSEGMKEMI